MKRNDKGRSAGGMVSGDIPFWPYGEPGPELLICQQPYAPNMDSTPAHLHEAYMAVKRAITHLEAIQRDSRVDVSVRHKALDALRDAQTAIEAECEAQS